MFRTRSTACAREPALGATSPGIRRRCRAIPISTSTRTTSTSNRVRLHRPHDARAAAGLEPLRGPGGRVMNYGDGLYGGCCSCDVRRGLLRDRPAPRGRGGPEGDPGRQRLPRLIRDVLAWHAEARTSAQGVQLVEGSGTGTTSARTGTRAINIDARINGPTSCSACCTRRDFARTLRSHRAGRTPTATRRGRGSSASSRLRADPENGRPDPGPRGHEVRVHELLVQRDREVHLTRPRRSFAPRVARWSDGVVIPSVPKPRRSSSGTRRAVARWSSTSRPVLEGGWTSER